jgi:murein DD-endopeptidase MepM/ murein hydrolase activator NlpD
MKRLLCVFVAVFLLAVMIMPMFGASESVKSDYIKYVEFNVTEDALQSAVDIDIATNQEDLHIDFITILAYLGAKYGGDFSCYKYSDITDFTERLKSGESIDDITKDMKYYSYYLKAYTAALNGMVGTKSDNEYGLCWYSPIAKTFPYSSYDDFGAVRTYGYTRPHLGHDMMAAVGTPVIAVESGTVECLGWNQYGGWRIGIRSDDNQRYWYYAHLRQNRPYAENLKEGDKVTAGDVIGYVGRTGYSTTENVNNITESHLHIGLELIFDESQKESDNEIWISLTAITSLLDSNKSEVFRNNETKEFYSVRQKKIAESATSSTETTNSE